MSNIMNRFIETIRLERLGQGLSYRDLANLAGCSHTTIYNIEHGAYMPTLESADKILKALGLSITIGSDAG